MHMRMASPSLGERMIIINYAALGLGESVISKGPSAWHHHGIWPREHYLENNHRQKLENCVYLGSVMAQYPQGTAWHYK